MLKFWIQVMRNRTLKPRTAFLPADSHVHSGYGTSWSKPRASRIVPAVPMYELNLFPPGSQALVSEQAKLDAVTLGRSILNVFLNWTDTWPYSPARGTKDMDDLHVLYEGLLRQVPPHLYTRVPIEHVEALAWQYLAELSRSISFMRSYARDDFNASGLMVDFANTIGCGEALEAVLRTRDSSRV